MNEEVERRVFGDLADLEKSLGDDISGERARTMIAYFGSVAQDSAAMLTTAQDAERQLVSQLVEAFYAAQRVIRKVWETLHGAALAL